jgi:hypothetical protein
MTGLLTLSQSASTILYTPRTYAYNDSSNGWQHTPYGHATSFPNASLYFEWNGEGIQVDGSAGKSVLASLDGAPLQTTQVNSSQTLINYPSLPHGSHNLTVTNPPGGNLTVSSISLFGVQKLQEGLSFILTITLPSLALA